MTALLRLAPCPLLLCLALPAAAAEPPVDEATTLDRIEVASTRLRGVPLFEVPASVVSIDLSDGGSRPGTSLSEALGAVPGVAARERQNFAQDTQLSIRGFGARSTFGVRGLRLYADGIPATMPDGQGQISHFALAGAERVEILRGPFSALHGNSSGGVVQIWSAPGAGPAQGHVQASLGRDHSRTLAASLRGGGAGAGYALAAGRFDTDGWRDHGAARRTWLNARLHLDTPGDGALVLVANRFDAPDAQDPLGLAWAQVLDDPRQATAVAHRFDTRKSVRQHQAGLRFEQPLGSGHGLAAMAWAGRRAVEQFLALPVAAQANPLNAGGVIDLDNDYRGGDLRWSWRGTFGGRAAELTAGASVERQRQHRRGRENFVGDTLGVRGALRRDERNHATGTDGYLQGWWQVADRWSLLAGLRHSEIAFESRDRYVTAANPDDSGHVRYRHTAPVAGVAFAIHDDLRVHLSAGRGFETPTFNELGYRADGGAGLAFDLRPAVSDSIELGLKWRGAGGAALEAALFRADTADELAVARNVGGRSSYRNAGGARRQGLEAAWRQPLAAQWDLELAATWLDARFREGYLVCRGAGCTVPEVPVAAGSRIPGVAERQLFARLQWRSERWDAALEAAAVGAVAVDDGATAFAPGHALLHLEGARRWQRASGTLRAFARVDNLLDRAHIGSVIVNEGNGRYYEPAPGRGLLLGLRWQWAGDAGP